MAIVCTPPAARTAASVSASIRLTQSHRSPPEWRARWPIPKLGSVPIPSRPGSTSSMRFRYPAASSVSVVQRWPSWPTYWRSSRQIRHAAGGSGDGGYCVPQVTQTKASTARLGVVDHAADAVLGLHQLEAAVHLRQREVVRDERVDVDVARQPALDQRRDALTALDAAERRARDPPARDQEAGNDVERLALAGHPGDGGEAPAHPGGLDGLAHDPDVAGGLERVVGAEAAGHLDDLGDHVVAADQEVGGALAPGQLEPVRRHVDADDPLGALEPAAGDGAETHHPGAEDDAGRAGLDLGGVHRRAETGREPAGEQAGAIERGLRVDLGERDLRHDRVLREGRRAHEVADGLAVSPEPGGAVGQVALALHVADREAQVRARAETVDALPALRREEGHDVVARGDQRHPVAD